MGKVYAELDQRLRQFISRQPVLFVATAPCLTRSGEGGHVNLSPKGPGAGHRRGAVDLLGWAACGSR